MTCEGKRERKNTLQQEEGGNKLETGREKNINVRKYKYTHRGSSK